MDETEEEAYRLKVYGTTEQHQMASESSQSRGADSDEDHSRRRMKRAIRKFSKRLSKELRRRSSLQELKPETPQGWVVFLSFVASVVLGYEINLQKKLTCPPTIYGQVDGQYTNTSISNPILNAIYDRLTKTPESILTRNIKPSLFVGTNTILSSTASFLLPHFACSEGYLKFREVLPMSQDGAQIGLDWELPPSSPLGSNQKPAAMRKNDALRGPIEQHLVIILHGMNNHAGFGYVQSLMRACTDNGWVAVGFNFRGCGGIPISTPRGYTAGYTGDIRCTVRSIGARLAKGRKIFLVGNSLGANLITKYLGEEGMNDTLPEYVAGGVSLANPLWLDGSSAFFPVNVLLSLGTRKSVLENWSQFRKMNSFEFQKAIHETLLANTIMEFDAAMAPIFIANNPYAPYETRIGYRGGKEEYWEDTSSFRFIRYISVPFLLLNSKDDFLTSSSSSSKIGYALSNPNVLIVQTKCGGHLGWQESPPGTENIFGVGTSWADTAATNFVDAVLRGDDLEDQRIETEDLKDDLRHHALNLSKNVDSRL